MKWISAAFGALLWLGCANPAFAIVGSDASGTSVSQAGLERLHTALRETLRQTQEPGLDKVALAAALQAILKDPNFPALSEPERHIARLLSGIIAYNSGDLAGAKEQLRLSSEMPEAEELDWTTRFSDSFRLEDHADAAMVLAKIARKWPAKLADYNDYAIFGVVSNAQKSPADAALLADLLETLRAAKWQPKSNFASSDELRLALTRIRLEKNDLDGVTEVAREIHDPTTLIEMRADKRFDAIVAADPGHFDIMKAFAAALADMKAKSAAAPDKLEGINAVAGILLRLKRPKETLDLIDGALARLNASPGVYNDAGDQIGWLKDQRADALFSLDRGDEAIAALAEAATHQEGGSGVNVSQAINLAEVYTLYDRPEEALAAVAAIQFSNASEYGRMALEDARACPSFELGDTPALAPILAYMKAHARDGAQPFISTMLCVGDLDGAAAEVIAELDDPGLRLWILYYLQDYSANPLAAKREAEIHAAWLAVRQRPDVAAAIARVGRIESYDLKSPAY